MPFAHVSSLNGDLYLPYPLVNTYEDILGALVYQQQGTRAELRVLPPGFKGELVPQYWRMLGSMARFTIEVSLEDKPGSARVIIDDKNRELAHAFPGPEPIAGIPDPFDARDLNDGGVIDENNPFFLISHIPLHQKFIYIGGIVVLGQEGLIAKMSTLLPTVPE